MMNDIDKEVQEILSEYIYYKGMGDTIEIPVRPSFYISRDTEFPRIEYRFTGEVVGGFKKYKRVE